MQLQAVAGRTKVTKLEVQVKVKIQEISLAS